MKNSYPYLPGRVLELIPLTEDKGRIYEQLVIVRIDSGQTIAIFDSPTSVAESLVGQRCSFALSAFLPEFERVFEENYSVESWDRAVHNLIHNRAFVGRVTRLLGDNFVFDMGCGTIWVHHAKRYHAEQGWFARISDFRLDILGETVPIPIDQASS